MDFSKNWHFNMLGIYNFNQYGSFHNLIKFIRDNHQNLEGDIVEAGVFNGHSLISIGLLLRKLGSKKKVFGFDTFTGFPPVYHEMDDFKEFENLFNEGKISKEHYNSVHLNKSLLNNLSEKSNTYNVKNISSSGEFKNSNLELIYKKIEYLGLDNIKIIKGPFSETMNDDCDVKTIMAASIDCDLYQSYNESLNFIWSKMVIGGFIHLDEYYSLKFPGARRAVDKFVANNDDSILDNNQTDEDFERWFLVKSS